MTHGTHIIEFTASGRGQAECASNPLYPKGIAVDVSSGAKTSCCVALPYPAPECGHFVVVCRFCGMSAAITAAGRADDLVSIRLPCRLPRAEGVV